MYIVNMYIVNMYIVNMYIVNMIVPVFAPSFLTVSRMAGSPQSHTEGLLHAHIQR